MRNLLVPAVPLAILLASCAAPTLKAGARYVLVEPDGDIGISDTNVTARNSLSDLGLDDDEGTPSAYVDFKWGSPHLRLATQSSSFEGTGTLAADFSIDDVDISAGAAVDSRLDLGVHSAILTFDLIPGFPEFGLGFGVSGLAIAGDFTKLGTSSQVDFDETIPIPVLAASFEFELGAIEVGGVASGLSVSLDDDEVSYFDIDVYGAWNFAAGQDSLGASLVLGWRQVDLDLEYEDDTEAVDLDLSFSGPYLGLQVNF
jgi:hypothetical protein